MVAKSTRPIRSLEQEEPLMWHCGYLFLGAELDVKIDLELGAWQ